MREEPRVPIHVKDVEESLARLQRHPKLAVVMRLGFGAIVPDSRRIRHNDHVTTRTAQRSRHTLCHKHVTKRTDTPRRANFPPPLHKLQTHCGHGTYPRAFSIDGVQLRSSPGAQLPFHRTLFQGFLMWSSRTRLPVPSITSRRFTTA
jgi:hypothetical protein